MDGTRGERTGPTLPGEENLEQLLAGQAALRRVATLVARGVPPEKVFAAVVEEVGHLLNVASATLSRYELDGTLTAVAGWGAAEESFPPGSRWRPGGNNVATMVFETGQPARMNDYSKSSGPIGDAARAAGLSSSVATPIFVEDRLWGAIIAGSILDEPLAPDTEGRLGSFTELVGMAIANAESRAELLASRARIVAAADESRRRIERDLHDGAQQRLVHTVIVLKLALQAIAENKGNVGDLVAEALRHAEQATTSLRELAHGILPASLVRGGLRVAVDGVVARMDIPVTVNVPADRLPPALEATAYFVISEGLTNVVKHAGATRAEVNVRLDDGELLVEVQDDGAGGARGGHGSGLGGLADRVAALDGSLVVESPPGRGTRLTARLPLSGGTGPQSSRR